MEEIQNVTQKKIKKSLSSNWVLSATALFVSVCTLFILIYQTHLSNKMYYLEDKALKASAMPIMELGTSFGSDYFRLQVRNVGIGPAKIKEVYVKYRDSVYTMDMYGTIMYRMNPSLDTTQQVVNFTYGNINEGMVVPINGSIMHINANDKATAVNLRNIFFGHQEIDMPINMAIVYTSIYEDENWTSYLFGPFDIPSDLQ